MQKVCLASGKAARPNVPIELNKRRSGAFAKKCAVQKQRRKKLC